MKAMRRATDKLHLATFAGLLLLLVCAASAGAQTTSPYDSADIPTEQAPTSSSPVLDVDQESAAAIESPDSIDEELKEARARPAGVFRYGPVSLIDPYVKWFDRQADEYGLKVGLTYTTVFQGASGGPGERDAMGSNVGLFGNWRLLGSPSGKSNGYLYFFSETRYEIFTGIPPNDLSRQIGSIWGTTNAFDEEPLVMRDLYWQQQFGGDTVVLRAGKIDPQVYYNSNYWQSDNKFFMSQVFSSPPVRAFPQDGLGVNVTVKPAKWVYISTGAQDAQGLRTAGGFNTFFGDFDLFSAFEVGFTPKLVGVGNGNYRFTYWYLDAGKTNGKPHDAGFDLSFDQEVGSHLIPFFRYGYSEGDVAKLTEMVSTGVGWHGDLITKSDVVGLGASWGQPSNSQLRDQYAAEFFYRLQVSPDNQLTFGYQAIIDPADAPKSNAVGVFEVRWRVAM